MSLRTDSIYVSGATASRLRLASILLNVQPDALADAWLQERMDGVDGLNQLSAKLKKAREEILEEARQSAPKPEPDEIP